MRFVFFGTPDIAVEALDEMEFFDFLPSLLVCNPDAPVGRKHILTPPPTKVWAEARKIPVFQPTSLKNRDLLSILTNTEWDFFVVFAYGKILPEWLIDLPKYGTINAHPSLLPKLRGASPIRSTLLYDLSAAGVTIIQMDKELDHGPLLYQEPIPLTEPIPGSKLDAVAGKMCGDLLVHVMQELPLHTIAPTPQDHSKATYTSLIKKTDGLIEPSKDDHFQMYRKYCAFDGWPGVYFFEEIHGKKVRHKITDAEYTDGVFRIKRVIPEGKSEQPYHPSH